MYTVFRTLAMNRIDVRHRERRPAARWPETVAAMDDDGSKAARIHQTAVSDGIGCRYHGRGFTAAEMSVPRTPIASPGRLNRHALSREFRRRIGWYRPDGGLRDMMARATMPAVHRDGVIGSPPPTQAPSPPRPITFGPDTEPPPVPPPASPDRMRPLEVRTVPRGTRHSALWNGSIARYHCLGHTRPVGARMRYAVHDRNGWPVAMPGLSTAAWKLAPRGRHDRHNRFDKPKKDIWLRPLRRDWKRIPNR